MATYGIKSIGEAIYNKMLEIKDVRVGAVYNHDIKIESGVNLPAIIITPSSGNSGYIDSCLTEQNLIYTVSVIDRIQDGYAEVEDNIRELSDIVLDKLNDLGTITWTNNNGYTVNLQLNYRRGFTDTQEPLRVFEITCNFKSIQNK